MTVVLELMDSRGIAEGDDPQGTLIYGISGAADEDAAMLALLGTAPTTYRGLVRKTPSIRPQGGSAYLGEYTYGKRKKKEAGDWSVRVSTTGGTAHITQSLSTSGRYAAAGLSAPDLKGLIGFDGETAQGVDIVIPQLQFTVEYTFAEAAVNMAYVVACAALTGTVNNAPFFGFAAGEVLFLGLDGDINSVGTINLSYGFRAGKNVTNLVKGDITVAAKKAHEYLWFSSRKDFDAGAATPKSRNKFAYVEKVYELADFSALGIGTGP